jgi:hypothetical protein
LLVGLGPDDRGTDQLASRGATTETRDEGTRLEGSERKAPKSEPSEVTADTAADAGAASSEGGEAVSGQTTAGSAVAPAPAPADALVAKIEAVTPRTLGGADFRLEVCNTSEQTVERSFANSQRYDFEVRKGDEVIWTWSDGRVFAQSTGTEMWKAGACKKWSDGWDGRNDQGMRAADGEYQVVGTLIGKPEIGSKPVTFCHGLC